ncbi:twin-arginine translocase TatA/TatE family subunit [Novosphingobium flavum]|uniref:Sec-independent protein translocase protein TatA n=1 Tax=Novosphingobium flavum TaxID=1778672 RepID=A0A7X1FS64_9SPHN|nr:twin-arginine translocase TatA/TatE family subunit [Novosphingobium flavum]MBC2665963.1 twin-arginine translocase TatA/TatE family subunit [Novosphingobium flavum]
MGFGSIWHWVIVLIVVLVLFGRGRVSEIMGDFGKGIKSFKEGMGDETKPAAPPPPAAQIPPAAPVAPAAPAEPAAQPQQTTDTVQH